MFGELLKTAVTAVVGGLVVLAGSTFGYWNKNRELDIRMVDVALTILSAKDDATKSKFAKAYALELLEEYGGKKIPEKEKWLQEGLQLPIGDWPSAGVTWDSSKSVPPYFSTDKNSKFVPPPATFDEKKFIEEVLKQLNTPPVPK